MINMTEQMMEYCVHDAIATEILYHTLEIEKLKQLQKDLTKPLRKLWTISLRSFKIKVVCERCQSRGYVSSQCNVCGGSGTHNKTQQKWVVNKIPEEITKIDRDKDTGNLRYWTSMSDFFYEVQDKLPTKWYSELYNNYPNGVHLAHLSVKDAQLEVDRLNEVLKERGVII